ncbi:MAG: hypothetical protein IJW02_00025 [Clostridia bacterium]|nr:hypothetical protein [Clostridia bacterium]
MKKRIIICLIVLSLVALLLASCGYDYYEKCATWEVTEDGSTLSDGTNTYTKYCELPLGMRIEGNKFKFYNDAVYDSDLYEVYSSSIESGIRYIYSYSMGITAYVLDDSCKASIDALVSGNPSSVKVISYGFDTYFDADINFVNTLDALSTDAVSIAVRKLLDADCYDVVYYDSEGTLAYSHGAIYDYEGELYYVNYDKLGNNYFDSRGDFSYGRGTVDMYKLPEEFSASVRGKMDNMEYNETVWSYEEDLYAEEDEMTREAAIGIITSVTLILGVILPIIPLVIGVVLLIKNRGKKDVSTYVLIGASVIWIITGIILLVVSL